MPRLLAIETSCDETAAAVLEDGRHILSSVVASQLAAHNKYGGVVPEIASREHLRAIVPVVREALEKAGASWDDLAAVAVTQGPGLVGALLVGITYAKAICLVKNLPLIAVNHLEGHIHAVVLQAELDGHPLEFPALALVVSGGHSHFFAVEPGFRYRLLSKTRDDAAGEAYDKVAKLLGFPYPGGPLVDQLAPYGNPEGVKFTLARMKGNAMDLSFSGLKTAVRRWVEERDLTAELAQRRALHHHEPPPTLADWLAVTPPATLDLLASFQRTVIQELLSRARILGDQIDARCLLISGGVASNRGLRQAAQRTPWGYPVYFPTPGLSTDNAAMIAAAAFPKWQRQEFAPLTLSAQPNLALAT